MEASVRWEARIARPGSKIRVSDLGWHELEYLAFSMREIDRHEIFGNLPTDNPLEFAAMVFQATAKNGYGWLGWLNERPVSAMGMFENFPGNWQVWSFGTDDYQRPLILFLDKFWGAVADARKKGLHRVECRSLESHREAHRLLAVLGFSCEAVLRKYGRDGSDYLLFARTWSNDDAGREARQAERIPAAVARGEPRQGTAAEPRIRGQETA